MTVTYMPDLSRVRVSLAIPAGTTDHVDVQRSSDEIRWSFVRGGEGAEAVPSTTFALDDYEFPAGVEVRYRVIRYTAAGAVIATSDAGSLTVALDKIWLKSVTRPFLNRAVEVRDWGPVSRRARNGVFDVVGRSFPVAVTDVRTSSAYVLDVHVLTTAEADEFDLILSSGDPVFLHTPDPGAYPLPGELMRSMYAVIGDTTESRLGLQGRRIFSLPLIEVAAPHHSIVGITYTWQSVINDFATWADVIAAESSWATLQELIGDPVDVVVP